jgi:hypothetical protein
MAVLVLTVAKSVYSGLLDIPPYHFIFGTHYKESIADSTSIMTPIIPKDNGGHILAVYRDFQEGFANGKPETLAPHHSVDHAINLEASYKLPYRQIMIELNRVEFN